MKAWENFLTLQEIDLGKETVAKWLRPLKILRFDACNIYLEAKDSFQQMWFEEHIRPKVKLKLLNDNNKPIRIHLSLNKPAQKKTNTNSKHQNTQPFRLSFDTINPHCKIENFILNKSNELPYKVISEYLDTFSNTPQNGDKIPVPLFNPIYLYGDQGTGKTHLLMAITHALRRRGYNALYTRAETFTEHLVAGIRAGEMIAFREAYRNVDALIIDNVHIFSRKGATQEELFHTFNTLHLAQKPLFFGSNESPANLKHIEPRLVSRFEWGISLNLETPSLLEIQQIIEKKAELLKFQMSEKLSEYLAKTFKNATSAIKALEALMLRFHMQSKATSFSSSLLTVPMASNLLKDLVLQEEKKLLSPEKIVKTVSEHYEITIEDILGKSQTRKCTLGRKIAMFFIRKELKFSYVKIGDYFKRDHSTVMTSTKDINLFYKNEKSELQQDLKAIQASFR